MIRSIEFDLVTKSEANQRFASKGGMMAKSARVAEQREATRSALSRIGAHVPPLHVAIGPEVLRNKIGVKLVRVAAHDLDDDNLRGALKAVRDAVAKWIGVDDRDPVIAWSYGQEKPAREVHGDAWAAVYRVRIEVEDLSPGEPRRVVLAESASAGRMAERRVKAEVRKATRAIVPSVARHGAVLSYQPEATARGASSAARGRVEEASPGARCAATGRPDAIVDRVSGAHETRALAAGLPRRSLAGEREAARDPGDEARPEALADCETCGAKVPARCTRRGDERMVYGVHVARARAAGLHVPDDDRAAVRPARDTVPTLAQLEAWREEGRQEERRHLERLGLIPKARKVVTVPQQARLVARRVWVALPWEQPMCPACKGARVVPGAAVVDGMAIACGVGCKACSGRGYRLAKLAPERSLEGMRVPREAIDVSVPIAYVARWGPTVRLYRREVTIPAHGVCWVYEAAQPQEGK